ncbi:aldehyde dehydrogenase family protein [Bacillus testis]|uniref:aldehyde dehydrogenase family protein n=1 Tax=Bacillus testis TaxID=1622072 RepID=UPI0009466470|nr:aldehyde dehydrogenase family protein [Bacillus testis]
MKSLKEPWKVYSPATGEQIYAMHGTDNSQVEEMVQVARSAFTRWSSFTVEERLPYFSSLRNILLKEMGQTVDVISGDAGKVPLDALVADIMPVLDFIRTIEKDAVKNLARQKVKTPILFLGKKSYIEYMPRGVVLVISPWNYPFQLSMVPILSALIAGNSVIAKPSEVTPYVGKYMEELFSKAGFPEGVVQFAHGGKELGQSLVSSKPDYIFFTGSVAAGRKIAAQAAGDLIPVTLELGGKDPMIVCHDANLARAAKGAVWGAFTNSGQVCMSVERLYVDQKVHTSFVEAVCREVNAITQGATKEDDIGSMTYPHQIEIVREHVLDALSKGAILQTGKHPDEWEENSMFLEPMVLTSVNASMKIMNEETFGPVLPIIPFNDETDAVAMANDSMYGLNASVWSADITRAEALASQLVSGAVIINDVIISVANHHLPFGGVKNSGVGRYHGENGWRMFCHEKSVMSDRGKKDSEIQWYPYGGKYTNFVGLLQSYFGDRKKWGSFLRHYLTLLKKSK